MGIDKPNIAQSLRQRLRIFARRVRQVGVNHGLLMAVLFIPEFAWRVIVGYRERRFADDSGAAFDKEYGVSTTGIISIAHTMASGPNWVYGFDYQPSEVIDFGALLAPHDIDAPNSVFVDLGAGKGRVLMCAAKLPFKRVIGVELAPDLCAVARSNITRFQTIERTATSIEVLQRDASTFRFPRDPLVLFMYNPFSIPVMQSVITNLCRSLRETPRRVVVIYLRPELAELWQFAPGFTETVITKRYRVFDNLRSVSHCVAI